MNMQVIGNQSSLLLPLTRYLEDKPNKIILPSNISTELITSALQDLQYLQNLTYFKAGFSNIYKQGHKFIFEFIDFFVCLTNLECLDLTFDWSLGQEGAKHIGKSLEKMTKLKKLTLNIMTGNRIGQEGAKLICEGILFLINLNNLELKVDSDNKIGEEGLTSIASSIGYLSNLKKLNLYIGNNNNLYAKGLSQLGNSLITLKNLKDLSLYFGVGNIIGDNGLSQLSSGLQQLYQLKSFSIDICHGNNISIEGISEFSIALEHLQMLKILEINLRDNIDMQSVQNLSNSIQMLKQLNSLSFMLKLKEQNSHKSLSNLMSGIQHLSELNILQLYIFSYSLQSDKDIIVFDSLQLLTNLKRFSIEICSDNNIKNDDIMNLVQNLKYLQNLEYLSIILGESQNKLQQSVIELGNSLKTLNKLSSLKIILGNGLKIKQDSMESLMEGIQTLTNLCFLTIEIGKNHPIGNQGASSINQCLQNLPNLKELSLKVGELNQLTVNSLKEIAEGLKSLKQLEILEIDIGDINSLILIDILNIFKQGSLLQSFKLNGQTIKFEEKRYFVKKNEDEKIDYILELYLNYKNKIDLKGVQLLCQSLNKMNQISLLCFRIYQETFINEISMNEFAKQISCLQNIQKLHISIQQSNMFGLEAVKQLSNSFKKLTQLTDLQIEGVFNCFQDGSSALANGLKNLINLKKLQLNTIFKDSRYDGYSIYISQNEIDIFDNFEQLETLQFNFQPYLQEQLNYEKLSQLTKLKHLTVGQLPQNINDKNLQDLFQNIKYLNNLEKLHLISKNIYRRDQQSSFFHESIIALTKLCYLRTELFNNKEGIDFYLRNILMKKAKHLVQFIY